MDDDDPGYPSPAGDYGPSLIRGDIGPNPVFTFLFEGLRLEKVEESDLDQLLDGLAYGTLSGQTEARVFQLDLEGPNWSDVGIRLKKIRNLLLEGTDTNPEEVIIYAGLKLPELGGTEPIARWFKRASLQRIYGRPIRNSG